MVLRVTLDFLDTVEDLFTNLVIFINGSDTTSGIKLLDFNTLEDLLALRDEVHEELVIGQNDWITIYDDFIE